jgi:hypothetical protein
MRGKDHRDYRVPGKVPAAWPAYKFVLLPEWLEPSVNWGTKCALTPTISEYLHV